MTKFGNRFAKILKENDEEKEAFDLSLDDETGADEFDIDTEADPEATANVAEIDPAVRAATAQSEIQAAMVATLTGWIADGDAFLTKLNDASDPNSVAYALGNAESDTLFDKMKSEQRRVSKVATDLAALNETMRGYLAQAQNPALRGV
jgi:hypothetical protein